MNETMLYIFVIAGLAGGLMFMVLFICATIEHAATSLRDWWHRPRRKQEGK